MESTGQNPRSLLQDALRTITRFVTRRPRVTLWVVVVTASACAGWTLTSIDFKTNRSDLIDPDAAFQKRWLDYTSSFGDATDIIVAVEANDPALLPRVIDELGRRMEQEPHLFKNVLYQVDAGRFPAHKGLQYLPPQQLERGLQTLSALRPYWQGNSAAVSPGGVFDQLSRSFDIHRNARSVSDLANTLQQADRISTSLTNSLENSDKFLSPWPQILPDSPDRTLSGDQKKYFLNHAGTMGFLKAVPAQDSGSFDGATRAIDRMREMIAEVRSHYPGVQIGLTGIPVLENDEMRRSRDDMIKAAFLSFLGVGLVLILGFRGLKHPLLALAMLAVGMAWSFGYTTLVVGHLNILSISFAVILIGLGIDFAIHYLARYLELRHDGEPLRPALAKTSAGVGAGVVTAAVTTAFAFFSATLTQFLGVAELGIIAGGGILLCAVATFVVLPALIALADRNVEPKKLPTPFKGSLLRSATARWPRPVALISLIIITGVGSQVLRFEDGQFHLRIRYDYNLLNLQADGVESVETQKRIANASDHSLLYAVSVAGSPEEARSLKKRFESLPTVDHVEELASAMPEHPHAKTRELVQSYRRLLTGVSDRPLTSQVGQPAELGRSVEQFYLRIRNWNHPVAVKTTRTIDRFLDRFDQMSLREQNAFLIGYQRRMAASLHAQITAIASATNPDPVTVSDLPQTLASRFISRDGKWLLQIYPKQPIWDAEPLKSFVADVRSVDANATGTPLQNLEASRQIKSSYKTASFYALAVIVLVLLVDFLDRDYTLLTLLSPLAVIAFTMMALKTRRIHIDPLWLVVTYTVMAVAIAAIFDFRNLRDALLAMLPPVGGGLLMFGVLGVLGVNLNPANLIVLPLVLGIGVDDGVHVVHDFRMQRDRPYRTSASTINAIVLTSLTSMIGFGSMMVAAHRGLYSVGLILVVGVGSCLFVSLVTLPAVLTMLNGLPITTPAAGQSQSNPVTQTQSPRKPQAA